MRGDMLFIFPSWMSKGDKSEKGYLSYILHFNLILSINIVGGSKMLWKTKKKDIMRGDMLFIFSFFSVIFF
jgi:hypothetical protein